MLPRKDIRPKDTFRLKLKGWKKLQMEVKKFSITILILDKIDFKMKIVFCIWKHMLLLCLFVLMVKLNCKKF